MRINDRLKCIGDLVEANSFCLDVGCDHAFLDIYLVKCKDNVRAIASDIAEGPLEHAKYNICREGLEDKIELRLGDGLDTCTSSIDTIIISGMGGRSMIGIFKNNMNKLKHIKTIILSPNNYQQDVKKFLVKNGFFIADEKMVEEKKFIYQVIKFKRGKGHYSKKEYFFGPVFLKNKDDLFRKYYLRELKSLEILLNVLPKNYYYKKFIIKRKIKLIHDVVQ